MPADPPQSQYQYIEVSDFTPGIFSDYFASVSPTPDGAAQVNGTWGCVAGPHGGLMAGPKKIDYMIQNDVFGGLSGTYDPQLNFDHINGFLVTPQVGIARGVPLYRACSVIVGYQAWHKSPIDGTFTQKAITRRYNVGSNISQLASGAVTFDIIAITSPTNRTPDGNDMNYYSAPMCLTRANITNPGTQPGLPTLAAAQFCWSGVGGDASTSAYVAFPKNSTPTVNSTDTITPSSGAVPAHLVAHQGRIIQTALFFAAFQHFGTIDFTQSSDILDYQATNDYSTGSGLTSGVCFAPENPGGVGAITTMNASELFVVRKYGGAYSIRGDIVNPQVVSLPSVTPTGIDANTGVLTPNGFVYGSTYGVYIWGGGDTSQCISDQLFGLEYPKYDMNAGVKQRSTPFWRDPASNISNSGQAGSAAQFAYAYPYIFAPYNWVMDTRTNGWFRFADPSKIIYSWYGNAPDGDIVAAPTLITVTQGECFSFWDPTQGTDYYTWTSQPLRYSRGRYIEARELSVRLMGQGHVKITITGVGEGEFDLQEYDIDSPSKPVLITRPIRVLGADLIVNIQSTSKTPNTSKYVLDSPIPAPEVQGFRIGYTENQTAR